MVSDSPVSLSVVPRSVCLRRIVISLLISLAGLSWFGGKYTVADAHTLQTQSYTYGPGRNPFSASQYSPQAIVLSPTIPDDYDLRSFLLSKLRQSLKNLHEKHFPGFKSQIQKRQASEKDLVNQLLSILQRLQDQREANPALTMPSLRFR